MTFHLVNGTLKEFSDKEVAKFILDFFLYQFNTAKEEEINARHELNAWKAANVAAQAEWERDNDLGWGAKLPYTQYQLEMKEKECNQKKHSLKEAGAVLEFIKTRFVEKFVS